MTDDQIKAFVQAIDAQAVIDDAVAHVSELTGIPCDDIRGRDRTWRVARARQAVMWMGDQAGLSLTQIGNELQRDHTTIMHGIRRVEEWLDAR